MIDSTVKGDRGANESSVSAPFGLDVLDWIVLHRARRNALVIGQTETLDAFCDLLRSMRSGPHACTDGRELRLPQTPCRMLFVRNVGYLKFSDQSCLERWLSDDGGRTQLIATSNFPIFPLVEQHVWTETLYYRLNVVMAVLVPRGAPVNSEG
jgi:hypothetical protein